MIELSLNNWVLLIFSRPEDGWRIHWKGSRRRRRASRHWSPLITQGHPCTSLYYISLLSGFCETYRWSTQNNIDHLVGQPRGKWWSPLITQGHPCQLDLPTTQFIRQRTNTAKKMNELYLSTKKASLIDGRVEYSDWAHPWLSITTTHYPLLRGNMWVLIKCVW